MLQKSQVADLSQPSAPAEPDSLRPELVLAAAEQKPVYRAGRLEHFQAALSRAAGARTAAVSFVLRFPPAAASALAERAPRRCHCSWLTPDPLPTRVCSSALLVSTSAAMRFFESEALKPAAVAQRRGEAQGLALEEEEQLCGLALDFVWPRQVAALAAASDLATPRLSVFCGEARLVPLPAPVQCFLAYATPRSCS